MPDHPRSRGRQLANMLLCASLALTVPVQGAPPPELPDFGDSSGNILTPVAEQRLGQAFMRSIRASEKVLDDPLLDDYLNSLGRRLTRHSGLGEDSFHFFLVDDPSVNAFAGPGGYIGVHTGLVLTTESESELAAVLAHEIAHVTQKHLARSWQATSDMSIPQAAVMIAAAVLGATVSPDAGLATMMGGQAAMVQRQIDFTRANEHEADRIGINLLADAGYEPHAMASFFTRMGRANRDQAIQLPEFLRTHPVTTNRIAEALDRAGTHSYRQPADDLRYQLLRQRLRVLRQDTLVPVADGMQRALDEGRYRNREAARFGVALALTAEQRPQEALAVFRELHQAHPAVTEYAVAAAQTAASLGKYQQALAFLDRPGVDNPRSAPLALTRSRLLLDSGQPAQALEVLGDFLARRPQDPRFHALAAQALRQTGNRFASHEHLATQYYLNGDTQSAIQQLEIALRIKNVSFYEAARLESRLAEYRQELVAIAAGR